MSDIRIHESGDGGELIVTDGGELKSEETFFSAIYQSIFEGSTYYNVLEDDDVDETDIEELLDRTVNISNLGNIESAINKKLQWLIDEGICSTVSTNAKSGDKDNSILVEILITNSDGESEKYSFIWDQQIKELKSFGEIQ